MGRPKILTAEKRVNFTLTVPQEVKDMADCIRENTGVSTSAFIEEYIRREYRKLVKSGKAPAEQIPGQQTFKFSKNQKEKRGEITGDDIRRVLYKKYTVKGE